MTPASFDEVHVYAGIGERTGVQFDRQTVRGSRVVCRSVSELSAKSRRMGDGFYYLASAAWPPGTVTVDLTKTWSTADR